MKKIVALSVALAVLLCMFGCQSTKTIEREGFSFSVPSTWNDPVEEERGWFSIDMGEGDRVLNVGSTEFPSEANPEEVLESNFANIDIDDCRVECLGVEKFTVDDSPAIRATIHTTYASGKEEYWGYSFDLITPSNVMISFSVALEGEGDKSTINTMKAISESIKLND